MKRLLPFVSLSVVATLFFVACDQSQLPTQGELDQPSLAIWDGTNQDEPEGNPDFFFLPPIVQNPIDDPNYEEDQFNPYLAPKVRICLLDGGEAVDSVCAAGSDEEKLDAVMSLNTDHYQFQWNTGEWTFVGERYRISVYIGSGAGEVVLGNRDVEVVGSPQEVPKDTEKLAYYVFNNGSNIPIKARIENGALCDPPGTRTCVTKLVDLGDGGQLALSNSDGLTGHLDVPKQTNSALDDVTLNFKPCSQFSDLPIDIPTFGACFEVDDFGSGVTLTTAPATISVCTIESDPDLEDLSEEQHHLVTLHRWKDGVVEALPHAADNCHVDYGSGTQPTGVLRYANAGLRMLRSGVSAVLGHEPLHAKSLVLHRGMGGSTPIFSSFQFALPAKMEKISGDGQIAPVLTTVAEGPKVLVTDLHGNPVAGATVHFSVPGDRDDEVAPVSVVTDIDGIADGIAQVSSWKLGNAPGQYTLKAWGLGIADPVTNGPRGSDPDIWGPNSYGPFDPFMPYDESSKIDGYYNENIPLAAFGRQLLHEGVLEFTATACVQGFGAPSDINGDMAPGEWLCANKVDFDANLSGGSLAPATLYWMNDSENLYLAVSVARDEEDKVNSLRFEIDDAVLGRSEGDDIFFLDGGAGTFSDMFVDAKCAGSRQSSCGTLDQELSGGAPQGDGAQGFQSGRNVYEIWHPLKSESNNAGDVTLEFGDPIRLFLTLSLGKGAQGNTQYPGFGAYTSTGTWVEILVTPPPSAP